VSDVRTGNEVRSRATVTQMKTGIPVKFEIMEQSREAIGDWCEAKGLAQYDWLFPSRKDRSRHLSTRQYARIVDEWVASIGLQKSGYGTHSMRRTKATLIYRKTGNLRGAAPSWPLQT